MWHAHTRLHKPCNIVRYSESHVCVRRCITRSTSYSTLCRDAGAVCNILQFSHSSGLIAQKHQLCENRVCVLCVCVSAFVYDVCGYVCEHVGGRTRRASKGLFTAHVCVCVRWCKAAKNYMHVGWTVCLSVCVCVAGVRLGHTVGWLMSSHCHAHILHRGGFR